MAKTNIRGTQIVDASVDLTVDVTGTLPVANGGTGNATNTLNSVLVGNGTGAVTGVAPSTSGNMLVSNGTSWASSATLTNPTINNYVEGVVAIGNTSTAKTIDLTNGTVQTATLTASCTFTMPTATAGKSFTLLLNTGTGSFTGTFTSVKWSSSGAPTITTTASRMDILTFFADGTNWYGSYTQGFTP
jgi:hypothetical protein